MGVTLPQKMLESICFILEDLLAKEMPTLKILGMGHFLVTNGICQSYSIPLLNVLVVSTRFLTLTSMW